MSTVPQHFKKIRSRLVRIYRIPRETPRMPLMLGETRLTHPQLFENPAPDWAWMLVDKVLQHSDETPLLTEMLTFDLLRWCEEGNPEARSLHVRQLIGLWYGPKNTMLRTFLEQARILGAGKRGKTRMSHFEIVTALAWNLVDEAKTVEHVDVAGSFVEVPLAAVKKLRAMLPKREEKTAP